MHISLTDGTKLAYLRAGAGTPLILIHGWACDSRYLAPQFGYFSRTHDVIAVDLRGHGGSDPAGHAYSPDDHARDLAELAEQLGLAPAVVVGHSMGGVVALRFEHLFPERAGAVIALDSAWSMGLDLTDTSIDRAAILRGPDVAKVVRDATAGFFLPDDRSPLREWLVSEMGKSPQDVLIAEWNETLGTDTDGALSALHVPALYIAAPTSLGNLETIRTHPRVEVAQVVGSGHFFQLESPDQVNAMIERFIVVHDL